jgi:hypothetical protein
LTGQLQETAQELFGRSVANLWTSQRWKESNKYREGGYVPPA